MSSQPSLKNQRLDKSTSRRLFYFGASLATITGIALFILSPSKDNSYLTGKDRQLASVSDRLARTQKLAAPLEVHIAEQQRQGETIRLVGKVTAHRAMAGLTVKWILPKGVTIVDGNTEITFSNLAANDQHDLELVIESDPAINHQVHLQAQGQTGQIKMGRVAQFNTRDQDSLNHERAALHKRAKDDIQGKLKKVYK